MKEHQLDAGQTGWDIDGAAQVLRSPATPKDHPLYGDGSRLTFPEAPAPTRLDLYPERLLVRYRSPLLSLTLAQVRALGLEGDHIHITSADERNGTSCLVYPDGTLTLALLGTAAGTAEPLPAEILAETPTAPSRPPSSEEADQPPRVVLTGRLGRDVHLRTTAKGRTVGRVSLAVHQGEETIWHTVLFFDDKAKQAAEQLAKGQLVTVVGYTHRREVQGRNGPRQVEEIYAASVQTQK
jgi:hypothetical protein